MIKARVLTIPIMCAVLGGSLLGAEDLSNYRGLQFGMNLGHAVIVNVLLARRAISVGPLAGWIVREIRILKHCVHGIQAEAIHASQE